MSVDIAQVREKVYQEIEQIPLNRLSELYQFIHDFRLGLESAPIAPISDTHPILAFAGSWGDFPNDDFATFLDETRQRREQAFSRRRPIEKAGPD